MLQGRVCWCYRGECVGVTGESVLVLQGRVCWCYRGECVDVTGESVLVLQGRVCCVTGESVLVLQGRVCWCYRGECVGVTGEQCLSQDLNFFPKQELLNFLGSYLQKRGVVNERQNLCDEARKLVRSLYIITCKEYTKQKI